MRIFGTVLVVASVVAIAAPAADSSATEKSHYWLGNPTPSNLLRPLSSDEADKVVGPYTVDAGYFQVESDLINYSYTRRENASAVLTAVNTAEQYTWMPRFKVGLCNWSDLEIQAGYRLLSYRAKFVLDGSERDFHSSHDGFLSVNPALKINLWGNDGGCSALAVVPTLSIPTEGSWNVMGGLTAPLAVHLPAEFTLKVSPGFVTAESFPHTVHVLSLNSASITRQLASALDIFASFNGSQVITESGADWTYYTGLGAIYAPAANIQLYVGILFGLNNLAADYNPYLGFTWRF